MNRRKSISISDKLFYEQLELGVITDRLRSLCHCHPAQERIDQLQMHREVSDILASHKLYQEMREAMGEENWRIGRYHDISQELYHLGVKGYELDLEDLIRLRENLESLDVVQDFVSQHDEYPLIAASYEPVEDLKSHLAAFRRLLDDTNQVRDDASSKLLSISKEIGGIRAKLSTQFVQLKKRYSKEGYLADTEESISNGRRVFTVVVESKRKVRGIIHDYSNTGKTAFIEPEEIVILNNEVQQKQHERKLEIRRLILELCDRLRSYREEIATATDCLVRLDIAQAKARLAHIFNTQPVKIVDKPVIDFREARHPVLYLKYLDEGKEVIPFDLELSESQRMLILSGPNAGGKSITMKTIGLIQLMVQCGLPVPLGDGSTCGIFHQIFTEIGDQQSIEDELSTYSSKMKSLKYFLQKSNARTLLLLDEFGSGTDPALGGAIAEAILLGMAQKKAFVVATTHYPNLKILAHNHAAMVNGAMSFDEQALKSSFRLVVGQPGNSYAFEIAERMGLPPHILSQARKKADSKQVLIEDILKSLQDKEQQLDTARKEVEGQNVKLKKLITNYEDMNKSLETRRRKLKLEAKEIELEIRTKIDKELDAMKSDLKEKMKSEELQKAKKNAEAKKMDLRQKAQKIKKEIYSDEIRETGAKIEVGSFVKMRSGDLTGEVVEIKKDRVWVNAGLMRLEANLEELVAIQKPIERNSKRSVRIQTHTRVDDIKDKIDLRGLKAAEASTILESYIDKALIKRMPGFTIVHGKGTGQLRNALWEILKQYPGNLEYRHPSDELGGKGITLVSFH